jgi:ATP-dependent DNA helicase RecG
MAITLETLALPIQSLSQVGPSYAQKLADLGIYTIGDLLHYYPFRYLDASQSTPIAAAPEGELITVQGYFISLKNLYTRTGKVLQQGEFSDGIDTLKVTWFNQPYLLKSLESASRVNLSGKIILFHGKPTLQSPQHEVINHTLSAISPTPIHTGRLVPVYHQTEGISSKWLRSRLSPLLNHLALEEFLPPSAINAHHLSNLNHALKCIHFPSSQTEINQAISRLGFDELFILQLAAQYRKQTLMTKAKSHQIHFLPDQKNRFIKSLPFFLTPDQIKAIDDISNDLNLTRPMNRLLQGDVGSGKTVVAAAALYASACHQLPALLIAPTQILAQQHYQSLNAILTPLGVSLSLQTGSHQDKKGDVYIGTHALLHRHLPQSLGVVVIDEQHRFGVKQRAQLLDKTPMPNVLSMTATPIPRTLALTLYADLDVSSIQTMPHGRKTVKTWLVPPSKRTGAYHWIEKQMDQKAQVFVVCPLIDESEHIPLEQVKAVTVEYDQLVERFPKYRLGLLHGNLKANEKNQVIERFRTGQLDMLVATPVIEVGINIPQATIILIESAERFGLASLHQLRGRVGRDQSQSYCLLFTSKGHETKRLKYLESIHSGIALAQKDLELRGPGDVHGLKQSGYISLKIASLTDSDLIQSTYQAAVNLIKEDPDLTTVPYLKQAIIPHLAKPISPN